MAFIIPQPETFAQSFVRGGQAALPGLVAGAQQRTQQQALSQLGQQFGVNLPQGVPLELAQNLLGQAFDPFGQKSAQAGLTTAQTGLAGVQTGFIGGPQTELTLAQAIAAGQVVVGQGGKLIDRRTGATLAEGFPPGQPAGAGFGGGTGGRAFREEERLLAEQTKLNAIPEASRTEAQKARLLAVSNALLGIEPPSPSQAISQKKLDEINRLQGKVKAGTATDKDKAKLNKLLVGVPLVEIGFGKPAAAAERTAIAETRASLDALGNLKTLFDSAQTRTGPVTGRVDPFRGLAGLTTDEQEAFMAATSAFKNAVIKQITGAQMSEPEAKRIMKQIPDITDPPTRWKAKWEQTKRNLQFLQKRRTEVLRQSGLRVPEGTGQLNIQGQQGLTADEETRFQQLLQKQGQ